MSLIPVRHLLIQERSAHTRTWNLKAALGPRLCKVNQQDQHTNVNQHVLAEEVPNNPNKNQTSSNHVQSVALLASPGTKIR